MTKPLNNLVIIESPFKWNNDWGLRRLFDQKMIHDSLLRGESPFIPELLYFQKGIVRSITDSEFFYANRAVAKWKTKARKINGDDLFDNFVDRNYSNLESNKSQIDLWRVRGQYNQNLATLNCKVLQDNTVVIESPFKGKGDWEETALNILYAQACLCDSLTKEEFPYASHLFFTQKGLLDDRDENERMRGIYAGLAWGDIANKKVVYVDRGISHGMELGMKRSEEIGQSIEERKLPNYEKWERSVTEKDLERVRTQFNF